MRKLIRVAIAYDANEQPWATEWKKALHAGITSCGDVATLMPARRVTETPHDVSVTWGLRGGRTGIMQRTIKNGGRHLVMERGFIGNREQWTALSFDGIAGRGSFPIITDPSRFISLHGHMMREWRDNVPSRALVMGQVLGDIVTRHTDLNEWTQRTINALHSDGWSVAYRPHPIDVAKRRVRLFSNCDQMNAPMPIDKALDGVGLVVTFNSTSAVETVLAGVRTCASDVGSPAYDVTSRNFVPTAYDRGTWAAETAWKQWSAEEIRDGTAWSHLRTIALQR